MSESVVLFVSCLLDGWQLRVKFIVDSGGTISQGKRWGRLYFVACRLAREYAVFQVDMSIVKLVSLLDQTLGLNFDDLTATKTKRTLLQRLSTLLGTTSTVVRSLGSRLVSG